MLSQYHSGRRFGERVDSNIEINMHHHLHVSRGYSEIKDERIHRKGNVHTWCPKPEQMEKIIAFPTVGILGPFPSSTADMATISAPGLGQMVLPICAD